MDNENNTQTTYDCDKPFESLSDELKDKYGEMARKRFDVKTNKLHIPIWFNEQEREFCNKAFEWYKSRLKEDVCINVWEYDETTKKWHTEPHWMGWYPKQ